MDGLIERLRELWPIVPVVRKPRPDVLPIGIVPNPAGAGKSLAMFAWMRDQSDAGTLHHIIACPSEELIKDHHKGLLAAGIPQHALRVITSDTSKRTIRVQLRTFFTQMERAPTDPINPALHPRRDAEGAPRRAAHVELDTGEWVETRIWDPDTWSVWWDEAPEMVHFEHKAMADNHEIFSRFVHATRLPNGLMQLEPAKTLPKSFSAATTASPEDFLRRIARNINGDGFNAYCQTLCEAIANPNRLVLVQEEQWEDLVAPRRDGEGVYSKRHTVASWT